MPSHFEVSKTITKHLFDVEEGHWHRSLNSSIMLKKYEKSSNLHIRSILYMGSKNTGISITVPDVFR